MLLHAAHAAVSAAPDVQALHLLRTLRHLVEAFLAIAFVLGLALGVLIGRAIYKRR